MTQLNVGDRVMYVPYHANGDTSHPDVELGTISSMKVSSTDNPMRITYFVRFDKQVQLLGWDWATSKGYKRDQLVKETP